VLRKVKCLVLDDEPLARELIETHIKEIKTLQHVASCDTAMKGFEVLKTKKIDLIFLDIQMPVLTGFDFLKSLHHPPKVIITTAFRDYAIDGYELDVVDYLLKPITFQRFLRAIEKYDHLVSPSTTHSNQGSEIQKDFVYLKSNKKNYKVYTSDILFIESLRDYIEVHTSKGKLIIKQPISEIENILSEKNFLRIHRSYLINVEKISAFTSTDVEIDEKELPIGSSYRQQVSSILNFRSQ
jgi:DNA-binding LytR/AlgR family response regulator